MRDGEIASQKREIFECFLGYLSFWVSGIKSLLSFFYTKKKKKKKKTNYKIHDWIVPFIDWIKIKYIGKLESYIVLSPSYNLPKIHGLLS